MQQQQQQLYEWPASHMYFPERIQLHESAITPECLSEQLAHGKLPTFTPATHPQ